MTLREAILSASSVNNAAVIYAFSRERDFWGPDTPCHLIEEEEDDQILERDGQKLYYFLEISTLLEVVEGWHEIGRRSEITEDEVVRVVIHYAKYDCWPPPE